MGLSRSPARTLATWPLARRYALIGAPAAIIFTAMSLGGAESAAGGALLSAVLCALLLVRLCAVEATILRAVLAAHSVSIAAALTFIALTAASALPIWGPLGHPLWAEFGFGASAALSISPFRTWEGLVALLAPMAAFSLGALSIRVKEDRDRLGRLTLGLALAFAFLALTIHLQTDTFNRRLLVQFNSPNSGATVFGVLAVLCAAALHSAELSARRSWIAALSQAPMATAALILCSVCLLLTASRAGIVCTLAALILLAALMRNGRPMVVLALVALVAILGGNFVLDRLQQLDGDGRRTMTAVHWGAFLDRPVTGHGLNTFHELNALYATPDTWPALRGIGSAHNIYVQILEESGVLGALLLVMMVAPPLLKALRRAVRKRSGAVWGAAALSAFALALAHGAVDFALQTPAIAALLAFYLGAFAADTPVAAGSIRKARTSSAASAPMPTPAPPHARSLSDAERDGMSAP